MYVNQKHSFRSQMDRASKTRPVSDSTLDVRGKTSTLHRESEIPLEQPVEAHPGSSPMGPIWSSRAKQWKVRDQAGTGVRLSPPEAQAEMTKSVSLPLERLNGQADIRVASSHALECHGPKQRGGGGGCGGGEGQAEAVPLSEFERRLVSAKQLKKAPMPEVDAIP